MNMPDFLGAVSKVNNAWTMAAFAIAAVLALIANYGTKPGTKSRGALYAGLALILVLALVPILASVYSEAADRPNNAIYRLRVTVVDSQNIPVADAAVMSTAFAESKSTVDGTVELAIPAEPLPGDKTITIFGAKPPAFLHGSKQVVLGKDHNPAITLALVRDPATKVYGAVQDASGFLLAGATVTIPGFDESVTTGSNGSFDLDAHGAIGQSVRLHVEKSGYQPVDEDQIVSTKPMVVQLIRAQKSQQ
jgi:hypothetical protein